MLFRNQEGKLMNVEKYNFKNDQLYFKFILNLKTPFTKSKETSNDKNK
jgi:hypothetical protein